jgi:hypothetical protein
MCFASTGAELSVDRSKYRLSIELRNQRTKNEPYLFGYFSLLTEALIIEKEYVTKHILNFTDK